MDSHQNRYLDDICDMHNRAKKNFGEEFDSDEEIFVHEFIYGHYHEEEAEWCDIAKTLSEEQLCQNLLAVIHVLIAGRVENRQGSELHVIMRFYKAFRTWTLEGLDLESPDDILKPMAEMKSLVVESAQAESRGWWADTVRLFSLIHINVLSRMGMKHYEVGTEYNLVINDLCNPKQGG